MDNACYISSRIQRKANKDKKTIYTEDNKIYDTKTEHIIIKLSNPNLTGSSILTAIVFNGSYWFD